MTDSRLYRAIFLYPSFDDIKKGDETGYAVKVFQWKLRVSDFLSEINATPRINLRLISRGIYVETVDSELFKIMQSHKQCPCCSFDDIWITC
jgi:hypothetical protein